LVYEVFAVNKFKTRKLCDRHGKKRELSAVFDNWDDFESWLLAWNHPVQYPSVLSTLLLTLSTNVTTFCRVKQNQLELNCTFNLDSLPVAPATALSKKEDALNHAIRGLSDLEGRWLSVSS
jgi:hypothetical protein